MSKLVFFNIPAYGHTNPTLGVVRELVARGNQVWYYSFAPFQKVIQEAGATFVPCDDAALGMTPSPEDSARVGKDLAFSIDLIVRATLALDEKICRDRSGFHGVLGQAGGPKAGDSLSLLHHHLCL